MKKKFFAIYALAGALVASPIFTSCVDDTESASVEALRGAKAEQLKSLAVLNNAKAEAALIEANAQAEIDRAEAAFKNAQAALENANAEEKAQLTAQAAEKFALELEKIKAEYAERIAYYNYQKKYYENNLWTNTESHIGTVYTYYTNALENVQTLVKQKLEQLTLKSLTEANAITAENALKQTIADLNVEKIQKERELAKWEAMKAQQPGKDDLLAELDELEKTAYNLNQNLIPAAVKAEEAAKEAYDAAVEAVLTGEKWVAFQEALAALNAPFGIGDWQTDYNNYWANYEYSVGYYWRNYSDELSAYNIEYRIYVDNIRPGQEAAYDQAYQDWVSNGSDPASEPSRDDYVTSNGYVRDYPNYWDYYSNAPKREDWLANEPKIEDYRGNQFGWNETQTLIPDSVDLFVDAFGYNPEGLVISVPTITESAHQILHNTIYLEDQLKGQLDWVESQIETKTGEEWEKDADGKIIYGNDNSVKGAESAIAYRKQQIAEQKELITDKEAEIKTAKEAATPDETLIASLEGDLDILKEALEGLEDMRELECWLVYQQEMLAELNEQKAEIEEGQAELAANLEIIKDNTAIVEALKTLEKPAVAYLEAQTETATLENALAEIGTVNKTSNSISIYGEGLYSDVKSLLDGIVDVQDLIDSCNSRLAEIEQTLTMGSLNNLVKLQTSDIYVWNATTGSSEWITVTRYVVDGAGNLTYEDALAVIDAEIARLESLIAIKQALADKYEAELNALLGLSDEAAE